MEPATQNQTENREMETTRGHKTDTVPTNSAAGRFPAGLRLRGQFPAEHMERTNHSVLFPAGENTQGSNNHMPRAMHETFLSPNAVFFPTVLSVAGKGEPVTQHGRPQHCSRL